MTTEKLDALRFLAKCGDRDAAIEMRAGDLEDLIDSYDALLRMLDVANRIAIEGHARRDYSFGTCDGCQLYSSRLQLEDDLLLCGACQRKR